MTVLDEIKDGIAYVTDTEGQSLRVVFQNITTYMEDSNGRVCSSYAPLITCKECATETVYPDGYVEHECELIGTWADSEWNPDGFCAWARRKEKC